MWANNEIGTVQPVAEVAALAAEHGIPVHTDAVQAVSSVTVDFADSGVDALTFTGHKLGGPFGVGGLVVRRELALTALSHGGGQERDIRSGTLDVRRRRRARGARWIGRCAPRRARGPARRAARPTWSTASAASSRMPASTATPSAACPATPT